MKRRRTQERSFVEGLAAWQRGKALQDLMLKFRVVTVLGQTGCGKSLCLPLSTLASRRERPDTWGCIVVAQPRREGAIRLAKVAGKEASSIMRNCDGQVGGIVGYRVGGDIKRDMQRTELVYYTAGWLLRVSCNPRSKLPALP